MRYHNIVYHMARQATQDDVIPLSNPIIAKDGRQITEIPVAKGQVIMPNIAAYNRYVSRTETKPQLTPVIARLTEIWGNDAHEWNPMRFINGKIDVQYRIGMFGNL